MTEKQGGTDVRANTTRAEPAGAAGPGEAYILVGHKWFLSAPMCDGFLMLAQAKGGLSCFLVPRFLPDGTVNPLRLQRLRSEEHTSELQSLMRISSAVFCLKKKKTTHNTRKKPDNNYT